MKQEPQPHADDDNGIEQLVEQLARVSQELTGIRQILDAVREDIAWWLNNNRRDEWQPIQPITNMPSDPAAPDWAVRLNRFARADLLEYQPQERPHQQARLDAAEAPANDVDEMQFCCEAPDLQWTGDARPPGVACHNCGYIVADCGSLAMESSSQAGADPKPKDQQRALFDEQ